LVLKLRSIKFIYLAVFFQLVITAQSAFSAEVFIDVERKHGSLIKVIVLPFEPADKNAETKVPLKDIELARNAIAFDLAFSGYFSIIKNDAPVKDLLKKEKKTGKTNWKRWNGLGADSLVRTEYYFNNAGELVIEGRLYDVKRKERIIGVRYTGTLSILRKMAHRFSDQIVYRFSGAFGIGDTRIAFVSKIKGHKELALMDYDGQNIIQLSNERSLVLSPAWSPSGKKITYTTYRYKNPDIYGIDLIKGVRYPVSKKIGLNSSASWSPTGKEILFTMSSRGNLDIYKANADGSKLKRLTSTRSIETSASFSPDGRKIVYLSDFSGSPQIYTMDSNGKNKRRFTFVGDYNADPAWSPRGDMIAYSGRVDGKFNIHIKRVAGKYAKQLTIYNGNNESASWSPDGRHLAFTSNRTGRRQIYIMNATGENQTKITSLSGEAFEPSWSPRDKE